jgi:hypothetical protein
LDKFTVIYESVAMFIGLIVLNYLNADIYEIYYQGWRDVDFMLHGIYQVINMISPNPPEEQEEPTVTDKLELEEDIKRD